MTLYKHTDRDGDTLTVHSNAAYEALVSINTETGDGRETAEVFVTGKQAPAVAAAILRNAWAMSADTTGLDLVEAALDALERHVRATEEEAKAKAKAEAAEAAAKAAADLQLLEAEARALQDAYMLPYKPYPSTHISTDWLEVAKTARKLHAPKEATK